MSKNKIDIKTGTLFPWTFQFLAGIVLLVGLALIVDRTILSLVLILGSGFMLTGYTGIEINRADNTYKEYNSFFFITKGERIKHSGIEKIFINSTRTKQQMHTAHTNHSAIISDNEYNAYLKLNTGDKIHLLTKRKKQKLILAITKIGQFLNVPVHDTTLD